MKVRVVGSMLLLLGYMATAGSAQAAAQTCDRSCLAGMITQYVDALVAHDYTKLPLAENVRYTEDTQLALRLRPKRTGSRTA